MSLLPIILNFVTIGERCKKMVGAILPFVFDSKIIHYKREGYGAGVMLSHAGVV